MVGKDAALMSKTQPKSGKSRANKSVEESSDGAAPRKGKNRGATAEEMGSRQRDISVVNFSPRTVTYWALIIPARRC